jgi:SAM-dependent methyltransferase
MNTKEFSNKPAELSGFKRWLITLIGELETAVAGAESLLDVGCGNSSALRYFHNRPARTVGLDGYQPSLDQSRQQNIHDEYVCGSILDIDTLFDEDEFDCVMSIDVIEHLPKEQGFEFIEKLEKVARHRIVIFTPNGFMPQNEHSGNPLQKHLSGWSVEEMQQRGYEVIGINGWKPLLGEFSLPRFWPKSLWILISRLTQAFTRNQPQHAFQILCVKTL